MCTYNITLNDVLVEKARPAFNNDQDLQQWIQEQVTNALESFVAKYAETEQHTMVKESMANAFRELHSGQARKDARRLFA